MVSAAVSGLGRLDIAINNAGINRNSAAEDTPEHEWDMTFAVNTKGVFLSCQVGRCVKHCVQCNVRHCIWLFVFLLSAANHC
jgi:NAD(P)-dependent dehydrogenase (short-subunit alcohol dehydrogenase family)